MTRFKIIRKDLNVDAVVIERDGLSIGRLTSNDLALNHPTVSRTQAGVKEVNGDYWISNLSAANGTLLNGELVGDTPLADGDVIQLGPFFLRPAYLPAQPATGERGGLQLEVEMSINPLPIQSSGTELLRSAPGEGKTIRLDLGRLFQQQIAKSTPQGTQRLVAASGKLTGRLSPEEAQALKVFWEKRLREEGKLATASPLKPQAQRRLGKAQFNWQPTRDLQRPWRPALFIWGLLIVSVLAVVAALAFTDAYAPGALSTAHARRDFALTPAVALKTNNASCTTCHALTSAMQQNCAACHNTAAFHSEVSDKHTKAGLSCLNCHTEHHGRDFQPAVVANMACTNCHRDGSAVISPLTNKPLTTPHGGTFGYPVANGRWSWGGIAQAEWQRKELPGATGDYTAKQQFHLVHIAGRQQGRTLCTECHTYGFEGVALTRGVNAACANCHGVSAATAAAQNESARLANAGAAQTPEQVTAQAGGPLCVSCHAQHGEEKELRASLRRMERQPR